MEATHASGQRLQLSGQSVHAGVLLGVFAPVGLAMMLAGCMPLVLAPSSDRSFELLMAIIMGAFSVAVVFGGVLFASAIVGAQRWLEGTLFVTKTTWRTTTVDLSQVEVGLSSLPIIENAATTVGRAPALMCRADGEEWVSVPLTVGGGNIMPRSHLLAIADAVVAGRPASPQAQHVVSHIRRLADTPLGRGALPPDWPGAESG